MVKNKNKKAPNMIRHRKKLRQSCIERTIFFTIMGFLFAIITGTASYQHTNTFNVSTEGYSLIEAFIDAMENIRNNPLLLSNYYPFKLSYLPFGILIAIFTGVFQLARYINYKDTMNGIEDGTGGFNESPDYFALNYSYPPKEFSGPVYKKILFFPKRMICKILLKLLRKFYKKPVRKEEEYDIYENDDDYNGQE